MPPENIRKPLGFLMFSGGMEKQHCAVMGLKFRQFLYKTCNLYILSDSYTSKIC